MPLKNAYEALEELKATAKQFPKKPSAEILEQKKEELKEICIKIFATRRDAHAERNNKEELQITSVDTDSVERAAAEMKNAEIFNGFLKHCSYSKLWDLASAGHGGKLEDKFKEYLVSCNNIRPGTPQEYMPKAKERIEALQKKIGDDSFTRLNPKVQTAVFAELLATRAAVNQVRHQKGTLDVKIDTENLTAERNKLLTDTMMGVIAKVAGRGKNSIEAAKHGHGGKLEDMIRDEVRAISTMEAFRYKLPDVDARYAPTNEERLRDIGNIMKYRSVSMDDKRRLALEVKYLNPQNPEGRIQNGREITEETEKTLALFNKYASEHEKNLILRAYPSGKEAMDTVIQSFHYDHDGLMKAEKMIQELDQKQQNASSWNDMKKVLAEQHILCSALQKYAKGRPYELNFALEKEQYEEAVNDLVESKEFDMVINDNPAGLIGRINEARASTVNEFNRVMAVSKTDPVEHVQEAGNVQMQL